MRLSAHCIYPSIRSINLQNFYTLSYTWVKLDKIVITCPALIMLWAQMNTSNLAACWACWSDQAFDFHLVHKKFYTYSNIFVYTGWKKNVFNTPNALLLALVHHLGTRSINALLVYCRSMQKCTYRDSWVESVSTDLLQLIFIDIM